MSRSRFLVSLTLALTLFGSLLGVRASADDIVNTAVAAGNFKTLVAAVGAAGLVDTLKSPGPFTVFAPTDEAFSKLPPGTVDNLLKPENKAQLVRILTYHVVPGKVMAADVVKLSSAKTVEGSTVRISVVDGAVKVDNANVVTVDVSTDNGVIHVVDSVLMPPAPPLSRAAARRKLESAVASGAALYNAGHHNECVNVYTGTMTELMATTIEGFDAQDLMETVLNKAASESHVSRQAWILRRGIDQMHARLGAMTTTIAAPCPLKATGK